MTDNFYSQIIDIPHMIILIFDYSYLGFFTFFNVRCISLPSNRIYIASKLFMHSSALECVYTLDVILKCLESVEHDREQRDTANQERKRMKCEKSTAYSMTYVLSYAIHL